MTVLTPASSFICPTSFRSSARSIHNSQLPTPNLQEYKLVVGSCVVGSCRLIGVRRERRRRLPDPDRDDGNPQFARLLEQQAGDALDGGVALEQVHRLAELLQRRHQGIVM